MRLNLGKTKKLVLERNIDKRDPPVVSGIQQVKVWKLLGIYFSKALGNWDKQFAYLMGKANGRMYILRICKSHGYSLDDLNTLFYSLIMSLFSYAIQVWGVTCYSKSLSNIDRIQKRAFKFDYIKFVVPVEELLEKSDKAL